MMNRLLCGACGVRTGTGMPDAIYIGAGRDPRKEVGTMGYLVIGIAFIVLEVVAAVKMRAGHA